MSFENYPKPQKGKESSEKKEKLVSIVKELFGYRVEVGIEKEKNPIRIKIDTKDKKVEAFATPEGIKAAYDFLKKPETHEKIESFLDSIIRNLKK